MHVRRYRNKVTSQRRLRLVIRQNLANRTPRTTLDLRLSVGQSLGTARARMQPTLKPLPLSGFG